MDIITFENENSKIEKKSFVGNKAKGRISNVRARIRG